MKRTLIALFLAAAAVTAIAAPPGRGPAPGAEGPGGPGGGLLPPQAIAELLDLSDAQAEQVQALRETMRATVEPLAEQQRANRQLVEEALPAGNTARVGELVVAGYGLRQQIKAAHDSFRAAFEGLLNAEQKAKWAVYEEIMQLRARRGPKRPE